MAKLTETLQAIITNAKVQIVALAGAAGTAATYVVTLVSTEKGADSGETYAIVWRMFGGYVIAFVVFVAIIANFRLITTFARRFVVTLASDWRAAILASDGPSKIALGAGLGLSLLVAALSLVGICIVASHIVVEEARYFSHLAHEDFVERRLLRARQFFETYQLHDAARAYSQVHGSKKDVADERLGQVERRYRLYRLLVEVGREDEARRHATPETAYRKAAAYLLYPYATETGLSLSNYLRAYEDSLAAHGRLIAQCEHPQSGYTRIDTVRDIRAVLEPPMVVHILGKPNLMSWYCGLARSGVITQATIARRWDEPDIRRISSLRRRAVTHTVVCPETVGPVPSGADDEPKALGHKPAKTDVGLSSYAAAQYQCTLPGKRGAGHRSFLRRMWQMLVPSPDG